jgi:AcrR family transcriptional regulator
MAETADRESGWRGSREGWLEAAHQAFVRGGLEAVTIRNLAAMLRLSRSSFYWHFQNRKELIQALSDLWHSRTTERLVAAAKQESETETQGMLNVMRCFLDPEGFDQEFEYAMRASALLDNWIMDRITAADAARLDALRKLMLRWGQDEERADVRARALYLAQIGYISMQVREATDTRMRRLRHYVEVYSGRAPSDAELQLLAASLPSAAP